MTLSIPAHASSENLRGIGAMLAAMASFVVNDTLLKIAAGGIPPGEVIFVRGAFTSLLCALLLARSVSPQSMREMLSPRIVGRSLADVGASFLFLVALVHMPIADVYSIIQFTPLAITAAAALLLGVKVGWRRWSATLVGLIGVLIILRPGGAGFDAYALLALASILFVVARDLFTRGVTAGVPGIVIAAASIFTTTLASLGFLAFETWAWPSGSALLLLFGSAVTLLAGHVWLIAAMRTGEIAVVAPFRYSIILWAVLAGLLVWHELPDLATCVGILIVCAAGLYTFLREHHLSRTARL